ncbi:MAG: hypothetical protein PHD46_00055 [Eubacteriales bacterium]|jgi:hypothetical protein|nr:hypothetical protein [Eubacteriales bacterium]MDD4421409.1 hypothetical protein [Eubacteriales bacterium]HBR30771.1 hypothetical protein [Clostridiales bacterium]
MGLSWSAMRKLLEQDYICDSLKGRIQYFATQYRKSHDQEGRVAVRLDGKEILKSCFYDWDIKRHKAWNEIDIDKSRKTSYSESADQMELEALNKGGFDQYSFYNAFHVYFNSSIDSSLISADPVVRLFAIMDKRVGKRRLHQLLADMDSQPEWLQIFYRLRLESDGIIKIHTKRAN